MEMTCMQNSIKDIKNISNNKKIEDENNFNLNEIAINSKIPNINLNNSINRKSEKSFDKFYYSMWISNKD
jgi:hypothetical protein